MRFTTPLRSLAMLAIAAAFTLITACYSAPPQYGGYAQQGGQEQGMPAAAASQAQQPIASSTAQQATATLAITNSSNEGIFFVYLSPSSDSSWGTDRLGNDVLHRGGTLTLSNIPPGQWDLRVVDASGNYKEWFRQEFNSGGSYTLSVDGSNWSAGR